MEMKSSLLLLLVLLMISQLPGVNQDENGAQDNLNVPGDQVKGVGQNLKHAKVGDDVILPCHLEPPFEVNSLTIEWRFKDQEILVYQSQTKDDETSDPKYKNRIFMFHDEFKKGNISLKLIKVTKEDEGIYTCFVSKPRRKVNITLKLGENGNSPSTGGPDPGVIAAWVVVVVGVVSLILIFITSCVFVVSLIFFSITFCVVRRCRGEQIFPCWSNNSPNEEVRNDGGMEMEQFQNRRGNGNQGNEAEAEPLQNQEEPN